MSDSKAGICARFSQNTWHDSKIIQLHVVKDLENDRYDLLLDLNMIVGYSEGKHERARKTGRFTNCRVIKADLDLLGMLLCGGDLACALCYPDAIEFERKSRDMARDFDLPDERNKLEGCLGFHFDLIHPGGDLIVIARDFSIDLAV